MNEDPIKYCKLCNQPKKLCVSHIIPRSFLKSLKKGSSQLIRIDTRPDVANRMDNANWSEHLLCKDCEAFLENRYEGPQLRKLRDYKNNLKSQSRVTLVRFEYQKFYLFWLSIIWRASLSESVEFSSVNLDHKIEEVCRGLIFGEFSKDDIDTFARFLRIGILRISEEHLNFDTRGFMTSFKVSRQDHVTRYYLVLEGFMVVYQISKIPDLNLPNEFSTIKNTSHFRIGRVSPHQSEILASHFSLIFNKGMQDSAFLDAMHKRGLSN